MSSYFEGWYFKHQKDQETLSIIAGRANDGAFIQVITQEGSYRVDYPLSAYHKQTDLQIADNIFSLDGISLSIHHRNAVLTGHLCYDYLTPIGGNIMGPFRLFPMQCRHTVVSMNHQLTGSVFLNGREIDFTGGKGYIEGDSGRSFPQSYTWVHCNDFKQNCSIMASVAHIPFIFCQFWGCICVVCLNGVEYRLATYYGAKILHRDERQLVLAQKDLTLRVLFLQPDSGHSLAAPIKGEMTRSIREVAPFSFVMSPTWSISGKRIFVTSMGKASISLAHNGVIPLWTAASGKPPIPSNKLPIVSIRPYRQPSPAGELRPFL